MITGRRKQQIFSSTLVMLLLASSVPAQTGRSSRQAQLGNWRVVQNLEPGTRITVKARKSYRCSFEYATQDELVCEGRRAFAIRRPSPFIIPRAEIREIRVQPNQAKHGRIGAGIGAGVGAVAGASQARSYRGTHAFFGALGGALFGSVVGMAVPIFRRGKIIYKR